MVSKKIRLAGFSAREWDLLHGASGDLCVPKVRRPIKQDLACGRCIGLMLAPPCSSWSAARDRTYPIRSRKFIRGIPGLKASDLAKVDLGNAALDAALDLARAAQSAGAPWILENPHTSKMWHDHKLKVLIARSRAVSVVTDYCQWGKPWRKRTRFLVGNVSPEDLTKLNRVCSGRRICSRTGRPHQHLEGAGPGGIRWTLLAMPYPARLAHVLASILVSKARSDYNIC